MIDPELIHPILITIAEMKLEAGVFNSKWKTRKQTKKVTYDVKNTIQIQAQLRNEKFASMQKITGGYSRKSIVSLWTYVRDVVGMVNGAKVFKFKAGDKIIEMRDIASQVVIPVELFVGEILYRAPYEQFNFVELICQTDSVTLTNT